MIFKGLKVSLAGMEAQRIRIDLASSNLANVNAKDENGQPYRRKIPIFETVLEKVKNQTLYSVKVKKIVEDNSPFKLKYDPENPDADKNGYVKLPNVDPLKEMVDMISAMRTYEANLTAFNTHKNLLLSALEIIKV